jgi:hypothetical protein
MPYIYKEARSLELHDKVDDFECVSLIKHFTNAPSTAHWKEGAKVLGNKNLPVGTAIATFVDGRYPNRKHGNHSAFYLGQVANGIYIIDQWPSMTTKPRIKKRFIYAQGKGKNGKFINPTENADAFSVIE